MPVALNRVTSLLDQARRALLLVWGTSRALFIGLVIATLIAGILPALAAWLGQRIVDAVVFAMQLHAQQGSAPLWPVVRYVLFEAGVLALLSATQRALSVQQSLLRVQLGQKVNTMILEKAQTLSLVQFENSEFYDKLVRVRREASTRPLALVMKSLGLIQNLIMLISFGVLLVHFSPWALALLVVAPAAARLLWTLSAPARRFTTASPLVSPQSVRRWVGTFLHWAARSARRRCRPSAPAWE